MSIKVIKNQIKQFVSSTTPEVMAIKGAWGVGKTYSWKKFLGEFKNENIIEYDRYSYVSLFGINSLEAFKYAIFENVVKKELIGVEASLETFKDNTIGILDSLSRKSYNVFKQAPILKSFTPAIESLSFLSLNKTLICIDDLERKGKGLDIRDILGLVSLLKEQKNCKIILLLNDGEDGLEDYIKYREKVIDIELEFSPSASECAELAYDNNIHETEILKQQVIHLGIKNIRVLKKIERIIEKAMPFVTDSEDEVKFQVIHSLALFSWCYYCSKDNQKIPTLDFVIRRGYNSLGLGSTNEEDDIEKKWRVLLHDYNYQITDELDLVLAKSVQSGYFIEDEFKKQIDLKNKQITASKSEGSFTKAWELYHHSFDDNQEEVINALYKSLIENAEYISPLNLNGTVTLFRELGENQKATEIIDAYINKRKETPQIFNLNDVMSNPFSGDIKDQEIRDKFEKEYKKQIVFETPEVVLARVSKNDSWGEKDILVLSNTTVDKLYSIFKSTTGRDLYKYIKTCLRLGNYDTKGDLDSPILINTKEALKKIANESEINKRRVKMYGIEVD